MKQKKDTHDFMAKEINYVELLHFKLDTKNFVVLTRDLQQLILPVPCTYVPMAPDHMLGVANVKGQIVCILDLAQMLDIVESQKGERKHCIILHYQRMHIGLIVGIVKGIHRIPETDYMAVKTKKGMHQAMKGLLKFDDVECQVLEIARLLK